MVTGDLNVPRDKLQDAGVNPGGKPMAGYILSSEARTHWGRHTNRTLDYAPCDFVDRAKIASMRVSPRRSPSDHTPIVQVDPVPGRACRMAGHLPHAVLGYSAPPGAAWRLALVVAECDPDPLLAEGR